jgi:hypothetical protein
MSLLGALRRAPFAPGMRHGWKRRPYGSRPTSSHASRTTSSPSATSTLSTKRLAGSGGARSTWARSSCSPRPPCRVEREVDASANSKASHAISHDEQKYCGGCGADGTQQLSGPKTAVPGFLHTCNSMLTQQSDRSGQSVLRGRACRRIHNPTSAFEIRRLLATLPDDESREPSTDTSMASRTKRVALMAAVL